MNALLYECHISGRDMANQATILMARDNPKRNRIYDIAYRQGFLAKLAELNPELYRQDQKNTSGPLQAILQ